MNLALVPGHRASSQGVYAAGFSEYPIAQILAEMIVQRLPVDVPGLHVEKFDRPDTSDGLDRLVKEINGSPVDGVLSLHFNATPPDVDSPDKAYSCIFPGSEKGREMAETLRGIGFGGIRRIAPQTRPNLKLLRETDVPCVLDEPVYLDRRSHRIKLVKGLDTLAAQYAHKIQRIYENRTLSDGKDSPVAGG